MASLSQESNPTADNEIRMRTKKKFKRNRSDQEQAGEDVNGVSSDKEVHGTSGAVLGANPASYKDMLSGANQSQDSAWQEWTENDDGDPMCFDEAISDDEESGDPSLPRVSFSSEDRSTINYLHQDSRI